MESKINTAIILVGGLGTRLRSVINDLPKPLADINGKPFLAHLIDFVKRAGIVRVILATGHLSNKIEEYFSNYDKEIEIEFSVEKELLGTGGAVLQAISNFGIKKDFLLLNGDSIITLDIQDFIKNHQINNSKLSLALKKFKNPHRYGTVKLKGNKVDEFKEKNEIDEGLINTGVYLINPFIFKRPLPSKFSFEKEILEKENNIYGFVYNNYFIDIGIPDDYKKAQKELFKYLD